MKNGVKTIQEGISKEGSAKLFFQQSPLERNNQSPSTYLEDSYL